MNGISKSVIERGLNLAKGATIYGKLIDDMTAEELKSLCALGWHLYTKELSLRSRSRFES